MEERGDEGGQVLSAMETISPAAPIAEGFRDIDRKGRAEGYHRVAIRGRKQETITS